jgi:hypothetical protein
LRLAIRAEVLASSSALRRSLIGCGTRRTAAFSTATAAPRPTKVRDRARSTRENHTIYTTGRAEGSLDATTTDPES